MNTTTLAVFGNQIRTDKRENLAFRHDDWQGLTGWELKNRGFQSFAIGGSKALFGVRAEIVSKVDPPFVSE